MGRKFGFVENVTNRSISDTSQGKHMSQMKQHYEEIIVPQLMDAYKYKNRMQVPRIEKIVLNMGMGMAIQNAKLMDSAIEELSGITGQKPVITKARKAIAAFKIREGMSIGCMVTLRHDRMYDFFNKLVNIALPRVRDFRGVSGKAFDGRGNYTLGIKEHTIFPEINYDSIDQTKGMNITIVTSATSDEESKALLKMMGMPFRN